MRRLTVSALRRQWGQMNRTREGYVPYIRLSGSWLSQLGIEPGNKIEVHINGQGTSAPSMLIRKEVEIDL